MVSTRNRGKPNSSRSEKGVKSSGSGPSSPSTSSPHPLPAANGASLSTNNTNIFLKELEEETRLLQRLKNKITNQIATLQIEENAFKEILQRNLVEIPSFLLAEDEEMAEEGEEVYHTEHNGGYNNSLHLHSSLGYGASSSIQETRYGLPIHQIQLQHAVRTPPPLSPGPTHLNTISNPYRGDIEEQRELHFNETLDIRPAMDSDMPQPSFGDLEEDTLHEQNFHTLDPKPDVDENEEHLLDPRASKGEGRKRKRSDDLSQLLTRLTESTNEFINIDDETDQQPPSRSSPTKKSPEKALPTLPPAVQETATRATATTAESDPSGDDDEGDHSDDEDDDDEVYGKDAAAVEQMKSILRNAGQ